MEWYGTCLRYVPVVAALGLSAALCQILAYVIYIRLFLKKGIRPNAASSFMFAYGTALMVLLEWQADADWTILMLPAVCAMLSICVAVLCLRKGATEPVDKVEKVAFWADIWLTVFWAAIAFGYGDISPFAVGFVIAGNLTTCTAFFPVLRSTLLTPQRENPLPWALWTLAYGLLSMTTVLVDKGQTPVLLIYPLLCTAFHGTVGLLALRSKLNRKSWVDETGAVYLDQSPIHGTGMFAGKTFAKGDVICTLTGPVVFDAVTDSGPNFIGIGPSVWIDPDAPLDHINHCCDANTAFGSKRQLRATRRIEKGEELLLDYSTTEADPNWTMSCDCGSDKCRGILLPIQKAFAFDAEPPPASPLMSLVWRKRKASVDLPWHPSFDQQEKSLDPLLADKA